MLTSDWAKQIRHARKALGLTQAALAQKSNVSLPFIQQIENQSANPSLKVFAQVLKALDLELTVSPRQNFLRVELITGIDDLISALTQISHQSIWSLREEKSAWGLLSALRDYYPTQWQKFCLKMPELSMVLARLEISTSQEGGRLKQRRMAAGKLAGYL